MRFLLILTFLFSAITVFAAEALEVIDPIWNVLGPILINFAEQYPLITTVVFFMGTFRFFMKPIMVAVETYIATTVTKDDDEFMLKLKANKYYKIFVFFLDWSLSLKLPK